MDALHKTELKFDRELHNGNSVDASINLQNEFQKNPKEALAIIQREQRREQTPGNHDKSTIGVAANGDVFVYDKDHTGYFAGSVPKEMMAPQAQAQRSAEQPIPLAAQYPAQTDSAPPPPPGAVPPAERGFHIPFPIDIGVRDGSLHLGVNVLGLVKGGVTLGEQNRGYVGSDVLGSEVSAGVDLNSRHIGPAADAHLLNGHLLDGHARVGIDPHRHGITVGGRGDINAFDNNVQAGGYGGVKLGRENGPEAGAHAYVGPVGAGADGAAYLSNQGLRSGVDAEAGVRGLAKVAPSARVSVGTRNEAYVEERANLGSNGEAAGIGLYDAVRPRAWAAGYQSDDY